MSIYQSEWSPGRPLRYHLKCDSCDTELVFTGSEEAAQFARAHMARPREEKPDICRACRDIALLKRIESGASRARQRASVGHGARGKALVGSDFLMLNGTRVKPCGEKRR